MSDNRLEIILAARDITGDTFKKVQASITDLGRNIVSVNGIISGFAGAAGLGMIVKQSIDAVAEIDRLATMAGVGVEAFQELTYAAGQYQISQDALTDGMKELSLRGDEFVKTGVGPAKESFERLGYTAKDLNEKLNDTPALLQDIISRMQGLDKAAQIRIADELFGGTGGEQFVAMIRGGSGALDTMRKSARDLGVVIDKDMVRQSVEAKKQVEQLTTIVSTQFISAVAELAPDIVDVSKKTTEWIRTNKDLINLGMHAVAKGIGDGFDFVTRAVDKTNDSVGRLIALYNKLPKPWLDKFLDMQFAPGKDINELIESINNGTFGNDSVTRPISVYGMAGYEEWQARINSPEIDPHAVVPTDLSGNDAALKAAQKKAAAIESAYSSAYSSLDDMTASTFDFMMGKYRQDYRDFVKLTGDKETAMALYTKNVDALTDKMYGSRVDNALDVFFGDIDAETERFNQLMIEGAQVTLDMRTASEQLADKMSGLNELLSAGAISAETYGRAVSKAQEDIKGSAVDLALDSFFGDIDEQTSKLAGGDYWANFMTSMENNMMDMDHLVGSSIESWTGQFGNFFAEAIMQSDSLENAFYSLASGMASSMLSAIGQMAAQWLVYQAVKAASDKTAQASAAVTMTSNAQAMSLQAGINAYSSAAAIPNTGWILAPGAMAAAMAATEPAVAQIAALSMVGMAHDGIDSVPETGTWLLRRKERVVTSETSAKLDTVLSDIQARLASGGGSGGGTVVQSNPKIINVWDESMISDHISSGRADAVIINRIKKNASTIKGFIS